MPSYRIGRIFGIPIEIDLTFLLVLPLFAWIIGSQVGFWVDLLGILPEMTVSDRALTEGLTPWILGSTAAVGLFVGVLLHELGHSVVAMYYGYDIDSIKLWLLGGVAQFTEMPEDWRQEFTVAIAGPVVSVVLGVLSYGVFLALPADLPALRFVAGYLALMNVALAGFNMLPGFPMDGGRVLRALLARNRPHVRATQIAASVGKAFAVLLGFVGLLGFNIILIAIAFFIYMGASSEAQQTALKAAFEGVNVRDVMTPESDLQTVEEDTTVADLLDRMVRERHVGYPVLRDGDFVGMVTLEDTQSVREVERDAFRVADVMTRDAPTVNPGDDVVNVLQVMQSNGVGRVPVMTDGELVGLLSRSDIMMAFSIAQSGGSFGPTRGRDRAFETQ